MEQKTLSSPQEMDALPDLSVVLLWTGPDQGIAAQKLDALWFVAGSDPHKGRTAAVIAGRAPYYDLDFRCIVLWEPQKPHMRLL